jgi:hypothetical protein
MGLHQVGIIHLEDKLVFRRRVRMSSGYFFRAILQYSLLVIPCVCYKNNPDSLCMVSRNVRNGFLNFGSVSVLKKTMGSVRFRFCEKLRFGSVLKQITYNL